MQLRLSLTTSGAVALGAYEAGALAGLIYAVRPFVGGEDARVRIDAIGGASAGSITALLAARALLDGFDPREIMQTAWVRDTGLGNLRGQNTAAPLSVEQLRQLAASLLAPAGQRATQRQATPVNLSFTLACLRGLDYQLPALHARRPVLATTYVDFFTRRLEPGTPVDHLVRPDHASPVDAALASAANPLGFPPVRLDRQADRDAYRDVVNFPRSEQMWYTDGGTLDNEPLGRTLDLTNDLDRGQTGFNRLQLLIHPHPTGAPTNDAWADPQRQPRWLETWLRAASLQRTQSVFADLKQVEKTNSRLAWANDLTETLGPVLDRLPDEARGQVRSALAETVARMRGQQNQLRHHAADAAQAEPAAIDPERTPSELLREAVSTAARVGGKTDTDVEVISPLILPEAQSIPVEQLLSGEFLFHFGGFLDENLRQADFDLGYRSTLQWLTAGGLTGERRLTDTEARTALTAATDAYQPGDSWRKYGATTVGGLSAMDKWQAVRLAAHITHVLAADLLAGRTQQ